jgi:hypothetical protein
VSHGLICEAPPTGALASIAAERNYIIANKNRRDFLKLYVWPEAHNGPIITFLASISTRSAHYSGSR